MSNDIGDKIIVISGPSGVGKTTLYKKVLESMSDQLSFSISATTRPQRLSEKEGNDYYFLSEEEFKAKKEANEFIEWAQVHQHYYGTLKSEIERIASSGKYVLLDLDVQGGYSIKKLYPSAHLIFILPPSLDELKRRLSGRKTDNAEALKIRMENALAEMKYKDEYPYQIINNDQHIAIDELKYIISHIIEN